MDKHKRRRYKDNPYYLISEKNKYYIVFKDTHNVINKVEVTYAIYDVFNCSELKDLSEMNEYSKHIEHLDLDEESIYIRSKIKPMDLEDEIVKKASLEDLIKAINKLPTAQKRRIKKYYFDEMTQKEIAIDENVDIRAIQYSLSEALKNLKKYLK